MKLSELKSQIAKLGKDSYIKVTASGKYEKEYMVNDNSNKSYEIRFNSSIISDSKVKSLLSTLELKHVHAMRIKNGFTDCSMLVEL